MKKELNIESTSIKRIVLIAMPALILAQIAQTTNLMLFGIGVVVSTGLIYITTLNKNRVFDYIMVMYMLCLFPAQTGLGGTFPLVAALIFLIHLISPKKFGELNNTDLYFKPLIFILLASSALGWLFVNQSDLRAFILGILSFTGILSLLYLSGSVFLTSERIIKFIKLNVFLAFYALIASLNTIVKIIPNLVFLPQWAGEWIDAKTLFDAGAGGIVGVSPLNGQHNLILAILFFSFYFYSFSAQRFSINKRILILGVLLSVINIFTAGSKAVFTALIFIVLLVYFMQGKLSSHINVGKRFYQMIALGVLSVGIFYLVTALGFDNVFNRYEQQLERNERNTGQAFTLEGVLDGTVLNRSTAFEAAFANYRTRNWLIGYGYSTPKYQIDAFYGNSIYRTLRGGSAHSQYFSTLFLFGWLGFFAFWILHIRGITKSYGFLRQKKYPIENRLFALATVGMLLALMIHGITADNSWFAGYFASTLIIVGLGYSNFNSARYLV